jgi:hypothetical protein
MNARVFFLILARVGRTIDRDRARQVRAVQQSKHDTAKAQNVLHNLIGYCMVPIPPLYFTPRQKATSGRKISDVCVHL